MLYDTSNQEIDLEQSVDNAQASEDPDFIVINVEGCLSSTSGSGWG